LHGFRRDAVTRDEIIKLERYLKKVFRLPELQVKQRPQKDDSAEVYVGDEFIGVLFATRRRAKPPINSRWRSSTTISPNTSKPAL
jgi:hypothetical protein